MVDSFPAKSRALVPVTLGSKSLPAITETWRWLLKKRPRFLSWIWSGEDFLLLYEAVFALQNWQTDAGADSLKLWGHNTQFLHLRIFTKHHKKPLMRRSRIPLFPCPDCWMSPFPGFGRAGIHIPVTFPDACRRKGATLSSPLSMRQRLKNVPSPTAPQSLKSAIAISRSQPSSVS